ncbi:MAG: hypothetical protein IPJ08_25070 [Burkholderiales bacterium]|nr:hypothetical protein [Burkholderiales bacterium]
MALQTDHLVKGCGATAMAFVDVMLKESDASFIRGRQAGCTRRPLERRPQVQALANTTS